VRASSWQRTGIQARRTTVLVFVTVRSRGRSPLAPEAAGATATTRRRGEHGPAPRSRPGGAARAARPGFACFSLVESSLLLGAGARGDAFAELAAMRCVTAEKGSGDEHIQAR